MTRSAYAQITEHGMSDRVGCVSFEAKGGQARPYSEATAQLIDEEAREMIGAAMGRALELVRGHREGVARVAERLLEREVLGRADMVELLGERPFAERRTYGELVEGTGGFEEDTTLPESLRGWNGEAKAKLEES